MASVFSWTDLLGSKPLLKKSGNVTTASLTSLKVVGFYFSAHWCPPCRQFTPEFAASYEAMPAGSDCEVIFVSQDRDEDTFKSYHGEMPWAALDYNEKDVNKALSEKFGVTGYPMVVLCDAKTGVVLTSKGRSVVSQCKGNFALEAPMMAAKKASAENKVKDLSILGTNVTRADDSKVSTATLQDLDVVVVAFGNPENQPWKQYVQPKLLAAYNELKLDLKNKKKFEVVYCSEDASEKKSGPWCFVPSGTSRVDFAALGDMGSPNVLVLQREGAHFKVIVADASRTVYESGADAFPWDEAGKAQAAAKKDAKNKEKLKQMVDLQLLQANDHFVGAGGVKVALADIKKSADVIALYFSAHWCGPCRGFTPQLAAMYKECQAAGKKFEIIFVSSDRDQSSFDEYFKEMPWKALAYSKRDLKEELSGMYGVEGIPSLVLLNVDGSEITRSGRAIVGVGADYFPWGPAEMVAGRKAAAEKAAKASLAAAKKEQDDIAAAEADGAFVFKRFAGEVGKCPINRTAGGSVYTVQFEAFDSFVSEEVPAAGKKYYEIECISVGQGIAQVGFADEEFSAGRGNGVGDDKHSWGFDGNRVCKWGNAGQAAYGTSWKDGDVLGCAIDFDTKEVSFYLNGKTMGVAFNGIAVTGKIRVAASAQGNNYKLKFNFGKKLAFAAPAGYTTFK